MLTLERFKQIPAAGGMIYIDRDKVLRSSQVGLVNFKLEDLAVQFFFSDQRLSMYKNIN